MDPLATLLLIDECIEDHELYDARLYLIDYRQWRAKGGFEPQSVGDEGKRGDAYADECEARISEIQRARDARA